MNKPKTQTWEKPMSEHSLKEGEYHPVADMAMRWFKNYKVENMKDWLIMQESIASSALSGNRMAEILFSTIERLNKGEPVSDRYLLALTWFLKDSLEHNQKEDEKEKT